MPLNKSVADTLRLCKINETHAAGRKLKLSVIVRESNTGKGVFAATALEGLTRVAQFAGPETPLSEVEPDQLNYVLRASKDSYLTPVTDARFVNHSCEPNCFIDDDLFIVTRTGLAEGTELTISYNRVSETEANEWGNFWHPAWTFQCKCGSEKCYGLINQYITDEVKPYAAPKPFRANQCNVPG